MPHPQDGLWQMTIRYSVDLGGRAFNHKHTFDIRMVDEVVIGSSFDFIVIGRKNVGDQPLSTWLAEYMNVWLLQFASTCTVGLVELHKLVPGLPPQWWSADDSYVGNTGTGLGLNVAAFQQLFTCRTLGGKIAKLQFMEGNIGDNEVTVVMPSANQTAYRDFVTGDSTAIVGRDDEFLLSLISYSSGQNEHLQKKRNRST